jgi:putative flippase GtrA
VIQYSEDFYKEMRNPNLMSAKKIVPIVISYISPKSIVDVGCGEGIWASVFKSSGVKDICGIDGHWVKVDELTIPKENFIVKDLEKPLELGRKYSLAVSLEVGEHLSNESSETFVKNLTDLAPVVLFSAAIPLQGGSRHINEQWPEYWEKKFATLGYVPVDCIRRKVWNDEDVSFFYKQNIFFFVSKSEISNYPKLKKEFDNGNDNALSLVHPHMYLYYAKRWRSVVPILGLIPNPILKVCKKILKYCNYATISQVARYLISGFTAAGTNLAVLYSLVEFGGLHYLPSSVIALSVGIIVSFLLHKLFTFQKRELSRTHIQIGLYLCVVGLDFVVNLFIMWFSVEVLGIPYLIAAIISGGTIAIINFIAYRFIVFSRH